MSSPVDRSAHVLSHAGGDGARGVDLSAHVAVEFLQQVRDVVHTRAAGYDLLGLPGAVVRQRVTGLQRPAVVVPPVLDLVRLGGDRVAVLLLPPYWAYSEAPLMNCASPYAPEVGLVAVIVAA
jgi:hypothetical protein